MELVVGSCMPERTVLLRVDPDAAHARGQQRLAAGEADGSDRFESEGVEFQRTVAAAYDEIAARHPERISVVDGEGEPAEVHARVHGGDRQMSVPPEPLRTRPPSSRRARIALAAALESPSHAYLFSGPAGSGKADSARAFAAELLALGAPDPDSARRRALLDPSPHPDLAWLRPAGAQHLVDEVRERIIEAAPYRPFEGDHRVFVVEQADAMAEESQNALLKTLRSRRRSRTSSWSPPSRPPCSKRCARGVR